MQVSSSLVLLCLVYSVLTLTPSANLSSGNGRKFKSGFKGGILNLSGIVKSRWQLSKKLAEISSATYEIRFADFTQHYRYVLLPSSSRLSSCLDGAHPPLLLATVLSAANHTEERQAIRESWASERESESIRTHRVVVFFIISSTSKNDLRHLQKEQEEHNDLIVTDLHETYENLYLKVYASMVFHQHYCPSAHFLMKVDDDVALHLDRMIKSWKRDYKSARSIFCRVWKEAEVDRNISSKFYVSKDVWPDKYYPPYCSGAMYIMGREARRLILDYSRLLSTPIMFEDILYTGIIAKKAGIRRVHWKASVSLDFRNFTLWCNESKEVKIFVHSLHSPELLRTVFRLMKDCVQQ